jgi:hypothetical protein
MREKDGDMEYELDSQKPKFCEELQILMKSAHIVKIHGWSRARDHASVLGLIKEYHYKVQPYSILNFAILMPN